MMLRTCVRSQRPNLAPKLFAMLKHFGSPERIFTKSLRTPEPLVENKYFRIRNSLQISIIFIFSKLSASFSALSLFPAAVWNNYLLSRSASAVPACSVCSLCHLLGSIGPSSGRAHCTTHT